jgi:hypothetical protein
MDFWTALLLAWVGSNVVIVALLWWHHWRQQHREGGTRAAAPSPRPAEVAPPPVAPQAAWPARGAGISRPSRTASNAGADTPPRFISLTNGDVAVRAQGRRATVQGGLCRPGTPTHCPVLELHDEIRNLKLTVAELSLDKAMLRAAASRRRPSTDTLQHPSR